MAEREMRGEFVEELESVLRCAFPDEQADFELSEDDIGALETELLDACGDARKRLARQLRRKAVRRG
ncbi:MAG TPA: hypothetical protein DCP69_10160 [Candidatus Omnitrophica bacterium]|nr:hypothetical protein [Candidatus Omnitrophota bacterium]